MPTQIPTNFDVKINQPIDTRMVKPNIEALNLIDNNVKYIGMKVFVKNENSEYTLLNNDIWVKNQIISNKLILEQTELNFEIGFIITPSKILLNGIELEENIDYAIDNTKIIFNITLFKQDVITW